MPESIIAYFNELPIYAKLILGLLGIGILFSLVKKMLKIAILLVVLVILIIIAFKLIMI